MAEIDTPTQPVVDPYAVLRAEIASRIFCALIQDAHDGSTKSFALAAVQATDILLEALNA